MGLRPMLSSLMRNKTGPLLVALQVAITLAIVINSLFIVLQRIETVFHRFEPVEHGRILCQCRRRKRKERNPTQQQRAHAQRARHGK